MNNPPPLSALSGRKILFVVFEYPSSDTAGYHTYNRWVLTTLVALGAQVHLLVLTDRYKKWHDRLDDITGTAITAPGLFVWRGHALVWGPRAWLGWWWRRSPLARCRQASQGQAHIGRWCTPRERATASAAASVLQPDLVLLDTLFCTPMAADLIGCPSAVVAHDVFSERVRELSLAGLRPHPQVDVQTERTALARAQAVIAICEGDAATLRHLLPASQPVFCFAPDPLPTSPLPPRRAATGAPRLFYMGSAAHHNAHGIEWFVREVWPRLRLRQPNIELVLAGDVGAPWAHRRVPGLLVLGRVDKPAQAAAGCSLAIDPVQAGSGVKLKILSYLALGLPCVTTPAGATGLDAYAAALFVADGPKAFCDGVLTALQEGGTGDWYRRLVADAQAQREQARYGLAQELLPLMYARP